MKLSIKSCTVAVLAAACLGSVTSASASSVVIDELKVRSQFYPKGFEQDLQNNLNFFLDGKGVDPVSKMPHDTIKYVDGKIDHGYYTNTTEIGLYLSILVEAEKAGNQKALIRIREVLDALIDAPKYKGLFYWPYDMVDGELVPFKRRTVPAVDNGNLVLALAGVAGAYLDAKEPEKKAIVAKVEKILADQKEGWAAMYDRKTGLLTAGWREGKPLDYHIDRKANESRTATLWAPLITQDMGKDAVPQSVFENKELYTATYKIDGKTFKPMLTWDGAYFQAMLPGIWLNEKELVPDYTMFEDMTAMQMRIAQKYGIPMVSSSATVEDRYAAFGIPELSESYVRYDEAPIWNGTGTPHATALSYMVDKQSAVDALTRVKMGFSDIETDIGWYDAVDSTGEISTKILSLDQGMFVGAFLAESINADVERYMKAKGYWADIEKMYQSFTPDN